jgi:HEPN domain-containing protein
MLNNISHLSKPQLIKLAALIQKIVQAIRPEKIICYGTRTTIMQDWTCFWEGEGYNEHIFPTTYDFLIITSADEKRADHEIIQIIEQQAEPLASNVTCAIQKIASINEALENGSRFATTVYHKGVLLYNGGIIQLAAPAQESDAVTVKNKITANWNQCFTIAQRFFKAATDCLQDGWNEQAIFNLHQSAQHTCMALLRAVTGYRSTTHNLSRLLAMIENFSFELATVFPCITKEEKDLFNLLNKSYSEARYNEQYKVPAEKATVLVERVREFLTIAERLYQQKLQSLQKQESISFPLTITDAQTIPQ